MATKIKWEDADFKWNNNPYKWDEVQLVEEVVDVINANGGIADAIQQLSPEYTCINYLQIKQNYLNVISKYPAQVSRSR